MKYLKVCVLSSLIIASSLTASAFDIAFDFPRGVKSSSSKTALDVSLDAFADKLSYGENDKEARIEIVKGKDINSVWYRVVNDRAENEISVTELEGDEIVIPLKCHGAYTVIVAGFEDRDDLSNPLEYTECYFYYEPDDNDAWRSLGVATMTDDFVASIFSDLAPLTFKVEVQQNLLREGQIRLVNPYGRPYQQALQEAGVPASAYNCDLLHNHYLYFDISDPDFVYMSEGCTGMTLLNHDVLLIGSFGKYFLDLGRSKNEIKFANYEGKLENNVITFHQYGLYTMWNHDYEISSANMSEAFRLELPAESGINNIIYSDDKTVKYFNLQGVEIKEPLKGIPCIRKSAHGTYVIIQK